MELEKLISDTLSLLKIQSEDIEQFEGIEININSCSLFLEKLPAHDVLSLSVQFCRYYDTDNLQKLFEILLNLHAYGLLTKGAFFAADSDNELVIFHKMIALHNLQPEELAALINEFYETFVTLEKTWKNGELDCLAKTAPNLGNMPDKLGMRV